MHSEQRLPLLVMNVFRRLRNVHSDVQSQVIALINSVVQTFENWLSLIIKNLRVSLSYSSWYASNCSMLYQFSDHTCNFILVFYILRAEHI